MSCCFLVLFLSLTMHWLLRHFSFRDVRCIEPPVTADSERLRYSADAASASDSAIAIEVNKHVEADTDGLDITSGLWLDHPQVSWLFTLPCWPLRALIVGHPLWSFVRPLSD